MTGGGLFGEPWDSVISGYGAVTFIVAVVAIVLRDMA
jgi:hypothetical protein